MREHNELKKYQDALATTLNELISGSKGGVLITGMDEKRNKYKLPII
jgi:hypothetical protein